MLLPDNIDVDFITENELIFGAFPRIPSKECNRRYKRGSRKIMRDIRIIKKLIHSHTGVDSWLTATSVYVVINKLNQKLFVHYMPKTLIQLLAKEARQKHLWRTK